MNRRTLGKQGPSISEVGLGCWQFGGDFGAMSEQTAMDIMHAAVESGVDFFDTADVYGAGVSEQYIGRFLKQSGRTITVATKHGRSGDAYPDQYSEETLRRSVEGSLERLGVERLDLLQLHCIPPEVLRRGEVFDWLRQIQEEGLIRAFGASVESIEEGLLCLKQQGLCSLQVIFNLFRQRLATELLPHAQSKGVGVIVRLPLASGLLSGKFTTDTRFAETDHRNYNRDGQHFNVGETFAGLPFAKGVELADHFKGFVPDGLSMAQMAQRWVLDHDAVSVIIPGASSPKQARENASISALPQLGETLHEQLAADYESLVYEHIRGPY